MRVMIEAKMGARGVDGSVGVTSSTARFRSVLTRGAGAAAQTVCSLVEGGDVVSVGGEVGVATADSVVDTSVLADRLVSRVVLVAGVVVLEVSVGCQLSGK